MAPRTARLIASLLTLIITFTAVVARGAGPAHQIYLPMVASGPTDPSAAPAPDPADPDPTDPAPSDPPVDAGIPPGFTEVGWARSPYSRLYVGQRDGRSVAIVRRYAEPAQFLDPASNQWRAIDTQLVPAPAGYSNAAGSFSAQFATPSGAAARAAANAPTPLVRLGRPGQPMLSLTLPEGDIPSPVVAGSVITYPDAIASADLVYAVQPWGIKEEFVLDSADAPTSYALLLDLGGGTLTAQGDGSWLVRDATGQQIWRLLPPAGMDAGGAPAPLTLTVAPEGEDYRVTLAVDAAWLRDPARTFPVRLDPSFADPQYIGSESYVQSIASDTISWNQRARYLGYSTSQGPKGINRIYTPVDLSVLPATIRPEQLIAARLVFTQYVEESTSPGFATSVYAVPSAWSYATIHWDNQPAQGELVTGGVLVSPALEQKRWDITGWARSVLAGGEANNGLMIRADSESPTGGGGIFWSSHCGTFCPDLIANRPFVEYEIALDSGLNPALDTWAWRNREGFPDFEQFARDYGITATTHLVTETRVLQVISATQALSLPFNLDGTGWSPTIPLSTTAGLTTTETLSGKGRLIPRPITYAYEETVVKAVYDNQFAEAYAASLKGGLCLGMAATVAEFYTDDGPEPIDYGGDQTVRSIPDEQAAQEFIQTIHGRQVGSQVMNWLASQGRFSVQAYYNRLFARIGGDAWRQNPEIIGIISGSGCEDIEIGHALLPYKLVPLANDLARVYVYDPNYVPGSSADADNRYIELDLASGTWTYQLAPGVIWQGQSIYSTPLSLLREKPDQPSQAETDILMVNGGHSFSFGKHSFAFGGHSFSFGTDGNNTHTGCYVPQDGKPIFVQEITRTYRLTPLAGLRDPGAFPEALFFPAGQALSFTGVGAKAGGLADMMVFGPRALVGLLGTAGATTRDTLAMDAAFLDAELRTTDAAKRVTLYQMRESDDWTRIGAVSNIQLASGERLVVGFSPDLQRMKVVNGSPRDKDFDLGLGHIGSDGVGQIVVPGERIDAGDTNYYTPLPWNLLPDSPVLVEIDDGSDGSIDRIRIIGGTTLPLTAALGSVPTRPGATFELATHDVQAQPNLRGWFVPQWTRRAGQAPTREMRGGPQEIQSWLADPANPGLNLGDELVSMPGTHGGLIRAVASPQASGGMIGRVMIVPLYDSVIRQQGGLPDTFRVAGFAVVRVLGGEATGGEDNACNPQRGCRKVVRVELLARTNP